jgi:hypothetical protein
MSVARRVARTIGRRVGLPLNLNTGGGVEQPPDGFAWLSDFEGNALYDFEGVRLYGAI